MGEKPKDQGGLTTSYALSALYSYTIGDVPICPSLGGTSYQRASSVYVPLVEVS
jgi:hypothetical protein